MTTIFTTSLAPAARTVLCRLSPGAQGLGKILPLMNCKLSLPVLFAVAAESNATSART